VVRHFSHGGGWTLAIEGYPGVMGYEDKIENKGEELLGQAKQGVGEATGDESLQAEGQHDEAEGQLKQAGEHVKDAAEKVKDVFTK
jgi:uncharacterized protein YjbJ (UPF0337 family)